MNFTMPNLLPAYPEIFLLVMVSVVLVVDLFLPQRLRYVTYALTQLTLLGCALLTLNVGYLTEGQTAYTFSNMFVADLMAHALKLGAYIAVSTALVYSRAYLTDRGLWKGEFFALVLFALMGMMVMISANHFLTLYLGLELLSLSLYALVALNRDSALSTEAAMKYFVLGALASGLLLYGMSMIYGATGTLDISQVAKSIATANPNKTVLTFGLVFLVSGMAFKLGVVPFHMWIPDVYQGAHTAMTLLIGSAPKLAAFAMAMRLLVNGLLDLALDWQQMLVIMSVLSMALGNFGMVMLLSRAGFEAENLDDFKGLNARNPWYAFIMLLLMFSLAGVPPTVGFYAKLSVLQPLLAADMAWLAVVAVLFSLIGAFYYLRIVKLMYFDEPTDTAPIEPSLDMRVLISANGLAVLALGIMPQSLMALCYFSIKSL